MINTCNDFVSGPNKVSEPNGPTDVSKALHARHTKAQVNTKT